MEVEKGSRKDASRRMKRRSLQEVSELIKNVIHRGFSCEVGGRVNEKNREGSQGEA